MVTFQEVREVGKELNIEPVIIQGEELKERGFGGTCIWAVTCDFQQCGILTSEDSDEHEQPPVKLRDPKWCSVSSLTLTEYSSD